MRMPSGTDGGFVNMRVRGRSRGGTYDIILFEIEHAFKRDDLAHGARQRLAALCACPAREIDARLEDVDDRLLAVDGAEQVDGGRGGTGREDARKDKVGEQGGGRGHVCIRGGQQANQVHSTGQGQDVCVV